MIITEAIYNRWVSTVKSIMALFERIGAGKWKTLVGNKLYVFSYNKTTGILSVAVKDVKNKESKIEIKKFNNDIQGLVSFTKDLVNKDDKLVVETCSCGAVSSSCVAPVTKPIGKMVKRKNKKKSRLDVDLFKESIWNDFPSKCNINGNMCEFVIVEGNGYMYVNDAILKTKSKRRMVQTVENLLMGNPLTVELLEGYSVYELNALYEFLESPVGIDDDNQDMSQDQEKMISDLENQSNKDISILDDDSGNIDSDQEYVGMDKENNLVISKNKTNGDVRVSKVKNVMKNVNL